MTTDEQIIVSDLPITLDLHPIKQNADWEVTFTVEDDNEDPEDITGWTAAMDIRLPDGTLLIAMTTADKITNGGATGEFTIRLVDTDTIDFPRAMAEYDFFADDQGGNHDCLFEGRIEIKRRVTREA